MTEEQQNILGSKVEEMVSYPLPSDVYLQVLNREKIPFILSHLIKGEAYDPEKDVWIKKGKAFANDEGVRSIITIVNSYISIDKIATKLSDAKIREMCYHLRRDIIEKFYQCWMDFEIEKSDLSILVDIITDYIDCNLRGSVDGTILNLLKHTSERREIISPQQSRHWWESLPIIGGR